MLCLYCRLMHMKEMSLCPNVPVVIQSLRFASYSREFVPSVDTCIGFLFWHFIFGICPTFEECMRGKYMVQSEYRMSGLGRWAVAVVEAYF